ncbi:MFS transporter [Hypoxylon rubiginosum]|uniref:MFS transporter n=1 Tax=Hypoxylon rubiginosum TaxID=110542 RepID=A0ACB9ZAX0_9PEZI|nr:MFS transporter [Hypoxylon rubiginosum]
MAPVHMLVNSDIEDVRLVAFSDEDPERAANWSTSRKILVLIIGLALASNSTLGSSLPSGASHYLSKEFNVSSAEQLALPNSVYLIGYVFGPPLFSPLSEMHGRRIVMLSTFFGFTVFTLACALAPTWPALLVFRFLSGAFASAPITVVGGIFADIYDDPLTSLGPIIGPIISGFVSPVSWRWTFWVGLIIAGVTWPLVLVLPETYPPVILLRRAKRMRAASPNHAQNVYAPIELEDNGWKHTVTVKLARPVVMFKEPIVICTCMYLALQFGIFYIFFQVYPMVFQGIYKFNDGLAGVALLPVGVGGVIACGIAIWYDTFLEQAKERNASWPKSEEYRRLPLACISGPLNVSSLFWLGWTARSDIHWIVPMLAGVPFGMGLELVFISMLNYLADAYDVLAASALASSAFSRSIFAVLLPLAASPMYERLGIPWACSLLGFLSLAMAIIPFVFLRYGTWLRMRSPYCQELLKLKERDSANTSQIMVESRNAE